MQLESVTVQLESVGRKSKPVTASPKPVGRKLDLIFGYFYPVSGILVAIRFCLALRFRMGGLAVSGRRMVRAWWLPPVGVFPGGGAATEPLDSLTRRGAPLLS